MLNGHILVHKSRFKKKNKNANAKTLFHATYLLIYQSWLILKNNTNLQYYLSVSLKASYPIRYRKRNIIDVNYTINSYLYCKSLLHLTNAKPDRYLQPAKN